MNKKLLYLTLLTITIITIFFIVYLSIIFKYQYVNSKNRNFLKTKFILEIEDKNASIYFLNNKDIIIMSESLNPNKLKNFLKMLFKINNNKLKLSIKKNNQFYNKFINTDDYKGINIKRMIKSKCKISYGPEDIRLIDYNDRFYIFYTGSKFKEFVRTELLVLNKYKYNIEKNFPLYIKNNFNICEKNWTPWIYNNNFYISYSLNPHKVYKINMDTGLCEHISTSESNINNFPKLKGGSTAILTSYGYLGIAHINTMKYLTERINFTRVYSHYFYIFERNYPFKITYLSKPFTLTNNNYEFINNIFIQNKELYINIGIKDKKTEIRKIHLTNVFNFIFNNPYK